MTLTRQERRRLYQTRTCALCRQPIAPAAGLYHARYDLLVHQGFCATRLAKAERDYSRSERGRRRPIADVLRRVTTTRDETRRDGTSSDERKAYAVVAVVNITSPSARTRGGFR